MKRVEMYSGRKARHGLGSEVGRVGSSQGLSVTDNRVGTLKFTNLGALGGQCSNCNDSLLLLFSFVMRQTYNGY